LFDARPFLLEGVNWDTIGFWQILSAVKEQTCPTGIVYAEPRSFDRGFLFLRTNSVEVQLWPVHPSDHSPRSLCVRSLPWAKSNGCLCG